MYQGDRVASVRLQLAISGTAMQTHLSKDAGLGIHLNARFQGLHSKF
jgi:hypothetical protein